MSGAADMERLIISMGMGHDAQGRAQHAAQLALTDAGNRAHVHLSPEGAEVRVTLGAPDPEALDSAALSQATGTAVTVTKGGLSAAGAIVVTAAIEVYLPRKATA